ncbi:MAG: M67 family metallopeptidase [Oscillospiraceae bacterium]|jgi:proteasome lid subunit RPN8/RPN11|nr:M67 family metallopeptidase [Oscillospiraceae bacterium]
MTLDIQTTDYSAIVAHCRAGLPNEACGLLAGTRTEEALRAEKVYLLTNTDASREHFTIAPAEHLAAIKDMRTLGLVPLGNFHSHPESPARMSAEDIRLARDPNAVYAILSLAEETPVLKAFTVLGDEPAELEIAMHN